jgi:hypothetical protein
MTGAEKCATKKIVQKCLELRDDVDKEIGIARSTPAPRPKMSPKSEAKLRAATGSRRETMSPTRTAKAEHPPVAA